VLNKASILKSVIALSCISALALAYTPNMPLRLRNFRQRIVPNDSDKLKYPIKDREGNFVTDQPNNPFYLKDPPAIQQSVDYDPTTGMYVVTEKVAGSDVRPPMYMTYEEYLAYTEKKEREEYVRERQQAVNLVEDKSLIPPIQVKKQFFDKLFGGSKIVIRPQGNV